MHSGPGVYRALVSHFCSHQVHAVCELPASSRLYRAVVILRRLSTASESGKEPLEVLKIRLNLSTQGARRALAISDNRKSHSYGELLQSSFQLSSLLQTLYTVDHQNRPLVNDLNEADEARANDVEQEESGNFGIDRTESHLINPPRSITQLRTDEVWWKLVFALYDEGDASGYLRVFKKTDADGKRLVFTRRANPQVEGLRGARVGIMGKPSAEFVTGVWGAWLSGAVAVPLALNYPEAELLHVLTDAAVSLVFATEEYRGLLEPAAEKCGAQFCILPNVSSFEDGLTEKDDGTLVPFDCKLAEVENISSTLQVDQAALIIYTSGTTGKPKGVVHTHASIGAQVRMLAEAWKYTPADRFLHCLPLHHVHGLVNILLTPLFVGASVEFLPKFSTWEVWRRWRESYSSANRKANDAITVFSGVPTIYVRLLQGYDLMDAEYQKASSISASKLRLMMCGSSALPQPVMEKWQKVTGHRLLERYGMTEFGMGLSNPLHGDRRPGFVGEPLPGVEVVIVEDEAGDVGIGSLCVKSPGMFREYWNLPQVTKKSFSEDGYFKTGDTVTKENGYYKILGRTSVDIVKSGGYKISSLEIEAVLLEHPIIAECVVMGIPDKDYGEIISAIVVPHEAQAAAAAAKQEAVLTLQALQNWAQPLLAPYKIPQHLLVWKSLPRNAMGKVNKKDLKETIFKSPMKL